MPSELRDQSDPQLVRCVSTGAKVFYKDLFVFQIPKESFCKPIENFQLHGLINFAPGNARPCFIIHNDELVLRAPARISACQSNESTVGCDRAFPSALRDRL